MDREILETEMNSGLIYDKEVNVSKSKLVETMLSAGESVFTVEFNKKVDNDHIKDVLKTYDDKTDLK